MPFLFTTSSKPTFLFPALFTYFLLIFSHLGTDTAVGNESATSIGGDIHGNSRDGKEVETAMKIAIQNFRNTSMYHWLSLHFQKLGGDAFEIAYAAVLIEEEQVQLIISMEAWPVEVLGATDENQAQMLSFSFAAATTKSCQWPLLVQKDSNGLERMNCTAAVIHSFGWRGVTVIYEENKYNGDFRILDLLSEALENVGLEIECRFVFPTFTSQSNQKEFVRPKPEKSQSILLGFFIILPSSLPLPSLFLRQTIPESRELCHASVISSMEGFLGSKTQYSDQSHSSFQQFFDLFQQSFKLDNPDEDISKPGTYAIQAYDSIISLIQAMERIAIYHISSEKLQERTLGSTFTSLKGEAGFKERLVEFTKPMAEPELSIMIAAEEAPNGIAVEESGRSSMNGKGGDKTEVMAGSEQGLRGLKQVLKGWVLNELLKLLGKSCSLHNESEFFYGTYVDSDLPFGELDLPITVPVKPEAPKGIPIEDSQELFLWQDLIRQVPKKWSVLDTKPMKIAIPGKATFEEFVKVEDIENSTQKKYSGFCIHVFSEVLKLLKHNHSPRYQFVPYYGTYNDLFDLVIDKTFDGIVGDIPIIANLSKYVDFTPPLFAHSGLSM